MLKHKAAYLLVALMFAATVAHAQVKTMLGGTGARLPVVDDQVLVGSGAGVFAAKTLPDCNTASTSKLLYDDATNAFSCGTDQTGGGSLGKVIFRTQTCSSAGDCEAVTETGLSARTPFCREGRCGEDLRWHTATTSEANRDWKVSNWTEIDEMPSTSNVFKSCGDADCSITAGDETPYWQYTGATTKRLCANVSVGVTRITGRRHTFVLWIGKGTVGSPPTCEWGSLWTNGLAGIWGTAAALYHRSTSDGSDVSGTAWETCDSASQNDVFALCMGADHQGGQSNSQDADTDPVQMQVIMEEAE